MTTLSPPRSGGSFALRIWLPALLLGVILLAVVLARPALPIDETRYLEVMREHLAGGWLVLHARGMPYAEKPPLLFWLARVLTELGLPFAMAMRIVPVLAATLTVFFVGRVGHRAGLAAAGWMQAALFLPLVVAQFLLFDSLLACAIWAAADAWTRGRDGQVALASSLALLAKGPVAFLFLVPLLWSLTPLRSAPVRLRRAIAVLALGMVPLAAWAIAAAVAGGPEFARALLWDRWAGRVVQTFAHRKPFYFYLPVVLVGALPSTLLLFHRRRAPAKAWVGRTGWAMVGILLAFTIISGKQAHYLVPAAPALALWCAWHVERGEGATRWLRQGVRLELLLFLAILLVASLRIGDLDKLAGPTGGAYLEGGAWKPILYGSIALLALGTAATFLPRRGVAFLLGTLLVCIGAATVGVHRMAGQLLYPYQLAETLRMVDADTPIARLGSSQHGLVERLIDRITVDDLDEVWELQPWIDTHPGGVVVAAKKLLPSPLPPGVTVVTEDVVHNLALQVLRISAAGDAPPTAPAGDRPRRP